MATKTLVVSIVLLMAYTARAQDRGSSIAGSVSASNMDSHTDVGFAGSFEYRFNRVVGFEIETTLVPTLRSGFPTNRPVIQTAASVTSVTSSLAGSFIQIFPTPTFSNPGGRVVMFTNSARVNIPTTISRITPYFVAGGGIANIRRTADFTYPVPILTPALPPTIPIPVRPITEHITSVSTDLALTLGGGVAVHAGSAFSIDADLRLFRLIGEEDRNLGRFGVGVRYRF